MALNITQDPWCKEALALLCFTNSPAPVLEADVTDSARTTASVTEYTEITDFTTTLTLVVNDNLDALHQLSMSAL
jgi:hypothetical protein